MFTLVVYHKETRKIILVLPLQFDKDVGIKGLDYIMHNGYDYATFVNTEPVFGKDSDGDIILKPNSFIINSKDITQ